MKGSGGSRGLGFGRRGVPGLWGLGDSGFRV